MWSMVRTTGHVETSAALKSGVTTPSPRFRSGPATPQGRIRTRGRAAGRLPARSCAGRRDTRTTCSWRCRDRPRCRFGFSDGVGRRHTPGVSCAVNDCSHHETTRPFAACQLLFSPHELYFVTTTGVLDPVGQTLLRRVTDLLKARQDLTPVEFGQRIKRGRSWVSEFFAGKRTTDDLRLVIKMAHVFGVSVAYLLGEKDRTLDPGLATIVGGWDSLSPKDRQMILAVVSVALSNASTPPTASAPTAAGAEARPRTRSADDGPSKRRA